MPDLHSSSVTELDVGLIGSGISASLITGEDMSTAEGRELVDVSEYADSGSGFVAAGSEDFVVSAVAAEGIACTSCSCMLNFSAVSKREEVVV